jgi:hypothetical protein
MADHKTSEDVVALASNWRGRHSAFKKWYDLIRLKDDLKQDKMESVIGSDPRTGYGMALWLVTPKTHRFVADTEGLTEEEALKVAQVEQMSHRQVVLAQRRGRVSLFGPFLNRLVGLMLATGWYAVASFPGKHHWEIEAWNPAQVYPDYSSEGHLIRLGRMYTISGNEANHRIEMAGWNKPSRPFGRESVTVYVLWEVTREGVVHSVDMNNHTAKPKTVTELPVIPVVTGPVNGLPDDGGIMGGDVWKAEIGGSLVAAVQDIQKNFDKMLTYMQQLIRDTANPRWVEKVRGQQVLTSERLYERGAILSIEPGEDIFPIATPPLPPELQSHQFNLRNQVQRGLFSDISFGNITQQVSGFLMNQVTSQAKQTLSPFFDAIKGVLGEVATRNISVMRSWNWDMYGGSFPSLPDDLFMDFKYDVEIPGDFIQRASTAKVLNPDFKLSQTLLYDVLFPEVQNALVEQGTVRAEEATANPVFRQVLLIRELTDAAEEARQNNDERMAELLDNASELVNNNTFGGEGEGVSPAMAEGIPPEAMPSEVQELISGRGF